MFICSARLTRKKAALAIILAGVLIIGLILLLGRPVKEEEKMETPTLTTEQERIAYLHSLGWDVGTEPLETLQFLLPGKLAGDYVAYNELQKAQGLDLAQCCGKQVKRYTYSVRNYPERPEGVQLNLYLCEDRVVAGDVFCAGENGFQDTLAFPGKASA